MQHLIVWTSEITPLADNLGWKKNAVGLWFNTKFGFGLMNAFGLVKAASNWTSVPERHTCTVPVESINKTIAYKNPLFVDIFTTGCKLTKDHVKYVEHVEVRVSISYPIRGALEIYLKSPSGN